MIMVNGKRSLKGQMKEEEEIKRNEEGENIEK
jgi:hypothetical protein